MDLQLFLRLSDGNSFLNASHECIVGEVFLIEAVKDWKSFGLKENPSLFCLLDDSLEEIGTCLKEKWFVDILMLVPNNVEKFVDDIVVN